MIGNQSRLTYISMTKTHTNDPAKKNTVKHISEVLPLVVEQIKRQRDEHPAENIPA